MSSTPPFIPSEAVSVRFSRAVKCGPSKSTSFDVWDAPKMSQQVGDIRILVDRGQVLLYRTVLVEGREQTYVKGIPISGGQVVEIDYGPLPVAAGGAQTTKEYRAVLDGPQKPAGLSTVLAMRERGEVPPDTRIAIRDDDGVPHSIPTEEEVRANQQALADQYALNTVGADKPVDAKTVETQWQEARQTLLQGVPAENLSASELYDRVVPDHGAPRAGDPGGLHPAAVTAKDKHPTKKARVK
jgi:hypothetical protein